MPIDWDALQPLIEGADFIHSGKLAPGVRAVLLIDSEDAGAQAIVCEEFRAIVTALGMAAARVKASQIARGWKPEGEEQELGGGCEKC